MTNTPPHSPEAELAVLGACMLDRDAIEIALEIIQPEDFFAPKNADIYKAILKMYHGGEGVDLVTLEAKGFDVLYLMECSDNTTSAANIEYHCRIVKEFSHTRSNQRVATVILSDSVERVLTASQTAEKALRVLTDTLMDKLSLRASISLTEAKDKLLVSMEEWQQIHKESGVIGVPTGFVTFDNYFGGWRSRFYILAARPSVGKTAFMLQSMYSAAKKGFPVAIFSLEMTAEELVIRILAAEANIDGSQIERGDLVQSEITRVAAATTRIHDVPLHIIDSVRNIEDVVIVSRKLHRELGIKCIAIDYLQLMRGSMGKENRQQEVSHISRECKELQKELDIPVIALSQLSRPMKGKEHFQPILSDLRESGSLEQDCNVCMFLHRKYVEGASGQKYPEQSADGKQYQVQFIIDKNRGGETVDGELTFDGPTTTFSENSGEF